MGVWQSTRGQKIRAAYLAECREKNFPCWLCSQPIDYDAPANSPNAFELDHFLPQDDYPDLVFEHDNFRPAHCSCNRARGKRDAPAALGPRTIEW